MLLTNYGSRISKTIVKQLIAEEERKAFNNDQAFIGLAILKGMYLGIGGKKNVKIPKMYQVIVKNSTQVFEFVSKCGKIKSSHGYIRCLCDFATVLDEKGIRINTLSAFQNRRFGTVEEIAGILTEMVAKDYINNSMVSSRIVYGYAMNYISKIGSEELCVT